MDEMIVVIKFNEKLKYKRKMFENGDLSGLVIFNSVVC